MLWLVEAKLTDYIVLGVTEKMINNMRRTLSNCTYRKTRQTRIPSICLIAAVLLFSNFGLVGCKEYVVSNVELYTEAANSILGVNIPVIPTFAFEGDSFYRLIIMERDNFGRILFMYCGDSVIDHSKVFGDGLIFSF